MQDNIGILDTYIDVAGEKPSTLDNWENQALATEAQCHIWSKSCLFCSCNGTVNDIGFRKQQFWQVETRLMSTGMGVYPGSGLKQLSRHQWSCTTLGRKSFVPAQARFTVMFKCQWQHFHTLCWKKCGGSILGWFCHFLMFWLLGCALKGGCVSCNKSSG